jgi:hypothetical protein
VTPRRTDYEPFDPESRKSADDRMENIPTPIGHGERV